MRIQSYGDLGCIMDGDEARVVELSATHCPAIAHATADWTNDFEVFAALNLTRILRLRGIARSEIEAITGLACLVVAGSRVLVMYSGGIHSAQRGPKRALHARIDKSPRQKTCTVCGINDGNGKSPPNIFQVIIDNIAK
jgi:hypothetical protein